MTAVLLSRDGTAEVAEPQVTGAWSARGLVRTDAYGRPGDQFIRQELKGIGVGVWPISWFDQMVSFPVDNRVPIESIVDARRDLAEASDAFSRLNRRLSEKGMLVREAEGRNG